MKNNNLKYLAVAVVAAALASAYPGEGRCGALGALAASLPAGVDANTAAPEAAASGAEKAFYKDVNLRAADGTGIVVSYTPAHRADSMVADDITVKVFRPGASRVRAVLINYYDSSLVEEGKVESVQQLDLVRGPDGVFMAKAAAVRLSWSSYSHGYNYRQEIAVVADGEWLKDPWNKGSNFRFKMSW